MKEVDEVSAATKSAVLVERQRTVGKFHLDFHQKPVTPIQYTRIGPPLALRSNISGSDSVLLHVCAVAFWRMEYEEVALLVGTVIFRAMLHTTRW